MGQIANAIIKRLISDILLDVVIYIAMHSGQFLLSEL